MRDTLQLFLVNTALFRSVLTELTICCDDRKKSQGGQSHSRVFPLKLDGVRKSPGNEFEREFSEVWHQPRSMSQGFFLQLAKSPGNEVSLTRKISMMRMSLRSETLPRSQKVTDWANENKLNSLLVARCI